MFIDDFPCPKRVRSLSFLHEYHPPPPRAMFLLNLRKWHHLLFRTSRFSSWKHPHHESSQFQTVAMPPKVFLCHVAATLQNLKYGKGNCIILPLKQTESGSTTQRMFFWKTRCHHWLESVIQSFQKQPLKHQQKSMLYVSFKIDSHWIWVKKIYSTTNSKKIGQLFEFPLPFF